MPPEHLPAQSERRNRSAAEVIRNAQMLLHAGGQENPDVRRVIGELDAIVAALGVLPDLHEQIQKRYDVLFPVHRG